MSKVFRDRMGKLMDELGMASSISVVNKAASSAGVGRTTSPTEKLDGGNSDVVTGDRAAENDADVRKAVPGTNVLDSKIRDRPDYNQIQLGTKKTPIGEDPALERDLASRPVDSPTSSPVNASAGEKYSSMTFEQLKKEADHLTSSFLERVIASDVLPGTPVKEAATSTESKVAAEAGYNLAAAVAADAGKLSDGEIQLRAKQAALDTVANKIQTGYQLADLVGPIIHQRIKSAEPVSPEMAGSLPPEIGGAPGGPGAGGPPPGAGMPSPEHGGGGGLSPEDEAEINEIANMMQEHGIPLEVLIQAIQEKMHGGGEGGGEGGGMSAEGPVPAGPPEEMAKQAALRDLSKIASAVDDLYERGRFRRVKVARGSKQEAERAQAAKFILETVRS